MPGRELACLESPDKKKTKMTEPSAHMLKDETIRILKIHAKLHVPKCAQVISVIAVSPSLPSPMVCLPEQPKLQDPHRHV